MRLVETMMTVGLCMIIGAAAFILAAGIRARLAGEPLKEESPGQRLDAYMLLVWSGMLLVQVSNILLHWDTGSLSHVSTIGWASTAADFFICGCFAGRLLLRREMRWRKQQESQDLGARS